MITKTIIYQVGIVQLELLLVELLQVLLYFLQLQQLHLRGGVEGNPKKFSSMYLVSIFFFQIVVQLTKII